MTRKNKNKQERIGLDICIPVYSNFEILKENINALEKACGDVPYKVYICDDKSPDLETKGKEFYREFQSKPYFGGLVYNSENRGFPFTMNQAVAMGRADYVLILNSDVIMTEGSIKIMYDHLIPNLDIGIIAPKLLFFENSTDPNKPAGRIQHCFVVFDINGRPQHCFVGWSESHPFANRVKDINAVSGACFLTRRSHWNKLKGFDLVYGKGCFEDMQMSIETRMMGLKIRYLPQAVGYHGTNMSVEKTTEGFPINRNFMIFKSKFDKFVPFDEFLFNGI